MKKRRKRKFKIKSANVKVIIYFRTQKYNTVHYNKIQSITILYFKKLKKVIGLSKNKKQLCIFVSSRVLAFYIIRSIRMMDRTKHLTLSRIFRKCFVTECKMHYIYVTLFYTLKLIKKKESF